MLGLSLGLSIHQQARLSAFVGTLDTLPESAGAWSLRKMRSAYAGSCVRVRRSSDNAEADIGFKLYAPRAYPYWVDEDALLAHVGGENLIAYSEQFDNAAWTKSGLIVTANVTNDFDRLTEDTSTGEHKLTIFPSLVAGTTYRFGLTAKAETKTTLSIYGSGGFSVGSTIFADLTAGTISGGTNATITPLGDGFYRIESTGTSSFTGSNALTIRMGNGSYTGDGTSSLLVGRAQLNTGSTAKPYAATTVANAANGVVTTWYDQSGNARHATQAVADNQPRIVNAGVIERLNGMPVLKFNGTSSSMSTPLINLTATDKITVSAVQRKLSDAIAAIVCEFSTNVNGNNRAFYITAPQTNGPSSYALASRGTVLTLSAYTNVAVAAPHTGVLTGIGDISGDRATLRVNGTQVAQSLADQGTGNYGNYNLFIGARNNSSFWYNGLFGELILFPSNLGTPDLATLETGQLAAWGITP